jgi:Fe2+ or Zn2+ uptake regulation protein
MPTSPCPGLGPAYRLTRQRREVYEILVNQRDHPTATELFIRVKERIPSISLATVYNCLEALTQNGLVKQVNLDRAPSRYCPNLNDHGHFHCESCGSIADISFTPESGSVLDLPRGAVVSRMDVAIRGLCPKCARSARADRRGSSSRTAQ